MSSTQPLETAPDLTAPPEVGDFLLRIEAGRPNANYWRDLWQFRELFAIMAWRDFSVRYKQSVLGPIWALIRPLATMFIGTVFFGKLAGFENAELPYEVTYYPLFVLSGTLPWLLFSASLTSVTASFAKDMGLIQKVYYPRIVSPLSSLTVSLVDFLIGLGMFLAAMLVMGFLPSWRLVLFPVFVLIAWMIALGLGLILGSLNVRFRDVSQVIPFILQVGLFLTPVMYPANQIEERFGANAAMVYSLNPLVGVIEGFRWAMLGGERLDIGLLAVSAAFGVAILWSGHAFFRATERKFADVV